MLLIVAHHYVVNSGLIQTLQEAPFNLTTIVTLLFGAWGKSGINCFILITGYFMCISKFSVKKLLKLYLQVTLYAIIIYCIFCAFGREIFSPFDILCKLWPIKSIAYDFVGCFLMFYLFIPVLNVLIKSMSRQLHKYLITILLVIYSILPVCPYIWLSNNYVNWFITLYMIASYIRIYDPFTKINNSQWGLLTFGVVLAGSVSVLVMFWSYRQGFIGWFEPYFFIVDSNKILSVIIAVCSFMYFKDLKIPQSKLINIGGASTFGVLLIHANSDTMRQWLWRDTIDCIGHFGDSVGLTIGYATISVILIFMVCATIDWFRAKFIEPRLLNLIFNRSKTIFNRLQIAK